jgi:hypothetical protein
MGIEPTFSAWEADVLSLNYTRTGGSERLVSLAISMLMLTGPGAMVWQHSVAEDVEFQSNGNYGD